MIELFGIIINQIVQWLKIPISVGNGITVVPWVLILVGCIASILGVAIRRIFFSND